MKTIRCECEAAVHFERDVANLPESREGSNHRPGARCSFVVRADVGGALICGGCDHAGHGAVRHPDAFERFNQADQGGQEASAMTPDQLEAINDSDALCPCGANPREAASLEGWFIDTILTPEGRIAQIRCPGCW